MMRRLWVIGKDGQVGRALMAALGARAVGFGQPQINLMDSDFIRVLDMAADQAMPDVLLNAAAYMQVDKAEGEGRNEADIINHLAVARLAGWCAARHIAFVHFSTDYVFSGEGDVPWKESDPTGPLNVYGCTKLKGEEAVASAGGRYLVFRTCWVFDAHGKNFANTMMRLFSERESLRVVCDQVGAPTYAPWLADAVTRALGNALAMEHFPSGIYHLCAKGTASWHEYAERILLLARTHENVQKKHLICKHIQPVLTSEYAAPAPRPLNSRLDCTKAKQVLGVDLPHWQEGLDEFFRVKYARE